MFYTPIRILLFNHSVMSDFAAPWTVACQAPLSMGFSRQGYWSGLPSPSPGDLLNLGIESASLAFPVSAGRFSTTGATSEDTPATLIINKFNGDNDTRDHHPYHTPRSPLDFWEQVGCREVVSHPILGCSFVGFGFCLCQFLSVLPHDLASLHLIFSQSVEWDSQVPEGLPWCSGGGSWSWFSPYSGN